MVPTTAELRASRLWKQMPDDQRRRAAEAFWTDEESAELRPLAVEALARQWHFRPRFVAGLPMDKKVRYLASLASPVEALAGRLLVTYHLKCQRPMMAAFLDQLGIAHDNGLITAEIVAPPAADAVASAVKQLAATYPPAHVALYVSTLASQDPDTWHALAMLPEARLGGQD